MHLFVILAIFAGVVLAAPASAHDGRGATVEAPPSVFPTPRDPWKSWGVRKELPQRVGPPREHAHDRARAHDGFDAPRGRGTVWVPGHWAWDGTTWVWWPGHWGVR
jgi:hypothetical protein